jgi:hypothetical protein
VLTCPVSWWTVTLQRVGAIPMDTCGRCLNSHHPRRYTLRITRKGVPSPSTANQALSCFPFPTVLSPCWGGTGADGSSCPDLQHDPEPGADGMRSTDDERPQEERHFFYALPQC